MTSAAPPRPLGHVPLQALSALKNTLAAAAAAVLPAHVRHTLTADDVAAVTSSVTVEHHAHPDHTDVARMLLYTPSPVVNGAWSDVFQDANYFSRLPSALATLYRDRGWAHPGGVRDEKLAHALASALAEHMHRGIVGDDTTARLFARQAGDGPASVAPSTLFLGTGRADLASSVNFPVLVLRVAGVEDVVRDAVRAVGRVSSEDVSLAPAGGDGRWRWQVPGRVLEAAHGAGFVGDRAAFVCALASTLRCCEGVYFTGLRVDGDDCVSFEVMCAREREGREGDRVRHGAVCRCVVVCSTVLCGCG